VVAAVVVRDVAGRVLVVRKRGTDAFMQPGGKPEPGEPLDRTAVRETREEVGLDVVVRYAGRWVCPAANEAGHLVDATVYEALDPVAAEDARAAAEIDELVWLDATSAVPDGLRGRLGPLLVDHLLPLLAEPAGPTVVGVGADGWDGLPGATREVVARAEVVVGSTRQLALVPDRDGQERVAWPTPLTYDGLDDLGWRGGRRVVVLASGDPLVAGVATPLRDVVAPSPLQVVPAVSSVALARARMVWSAEETTVLRDHAELPRHLAPGARVLVLSAYAVTAAQVADLLVDHGYAATTMTALGDLGSPRESRTTARAGDWARARPAVPQLHVLALDLAGPAGVGGVAVTGLPDDAYEHDGQLTKRDLRAAALARLAPRPGELLWDVGAGAGSVGVEWLRAHPTTRGVAVEVAPERAARVARNAARLGVPRLDVRTGRAPDALADLPAPDAVFVGGGATAPGLLEACRTRLRPGGRLVVHGVTLETEQLLAAAYAEHGGELTRHAVEHASPIGSFTGWTPARAVTQWAWVAP